MHDQMGSETRPVLSVNALAILRCLYRVQKSQNTLKCGQGSRIAPTKVSRAKRERSAEHRQHVNWVWSINPLVKCGLPVQYESQLPQSTLRKAHGLAMVSL